MKLVIPTAEPLLAPSISHSVPLAGPVSVSVPTPPMIAMAIGSTATTAKPSAPPSPSSTMLVTPAATVPNERATPLSVSLIRRPPSLDTGSATPSSSTATLSAAAVRSPVSTPPL